MLSTLGVPFSINSWEKVLSQKYVVDVILGLHVTKLGGIMLVKEAPALYCTKCGTRIPDGGQCINKCEGKNRSALAPACRVRSNQIPGLIGSQLTKIQADGLAFGAKNLIVKSAVIQSFNIGSNSSGTVKFAAVGRSFGPWAIFGGMGSINQTSVNSYRTDVQIKLEDESGQKAFLNYSLPFAITLAIEPGESLRIYFVQGGLQKPSAEGDYRVDAWSPFVAENTDTGQLIPISGVPTLGPPKNVFLVAAVVAGLITFFLMLGQAAAETVLFSCVVTVPLIMASILRARNYKLSLAEATRKALASAV
jgi:hypothetical protein